MIDELNESSLSRIWQHITSGVPFCILTAFRGENELPENRKRNQELKNTLRSANYGFIPVKGGYKEKKKIDGVEVENEVKEESLIVIGKQISRANQGKEKPTKQEEQDFMRFVFKQGIKYKQDSILFVGSNGKAKLISTRNDGFIGPIGAIRNLKDWKADPATLGAFFTELKGGSRFIFESVEDIKYRSISGFLEALVIDGNRKKILDEGKDYNIDIDLD